MSKPEPIEYKLDEWGITFSTECWEKYDGKEKHFQAHIYWTATVNSTVDRVREYKNFFDFTDAQKWIECQVKGDK